MIRHTIIGAKGTVVLDFPEPPEGQSPVMHLRTYGEHQEFTESEALHLASVMVQVFAELARDPAKGGRDE